MFQLDDQEFRNLKSQIVTSSWGSLAPYAFTEQAVEMSSSVLRSRRQSRSTSRSCAFVRLRRILAPQAQLPRKLHALENKYDAHFIKSSSMPSAGLMTPPTQSPTHRLRIEVR